MPLIGTAPNGEPARMSRAYEPRHPPARRSGRDHDPRHPPPGRSGRDCRNPVAREWARRVASHPPARGTVPRAGTARVGCDAGSERLEVSPSTRGRLEVGPSTRRRSPLRQPMRLLRRHILRATSYELYRAIVTRYDKLKRNDESMLALACGFFMAPNVKRQHALVVRPRGLAYHPGA